MFDLFKGRKQFINLKMIIIMALTKLLLAVVTYSLRNDWVALIFRFSVAITFHGISGMPES